MNKYLNGGVGKSVCVSLRLRFGGLVIPALRHYNPLIWILRWCETNNFVLVTNNRKTMAGELTKHVAQGGHVPGIFMVNPGANVREVAEDLSLIEGASFPNEFQDQIRYLPLG
jgi:hypothetical protein